MSRVTLFHRPTFVAANYVLVLRYLGTDQHGLLHLWHRRRRSQARVGRWSTPIQSMSIESAVTDVGTQADNAFRDIQAANSLLESPQLNYRLAG